MVQPEPEIRAIFCAALERPTAALQSDYLDEVCRGKPQLRARIAALLEAHRDAASAGDTHGARDPSALYEMPPIERPGVDIGCYRLLEQIGEGGMGAVYMAEQREPIRRKVALKIIKPGMDTKEVVARFEAERQALAMMDHPNIAKVLDAGSTVSPGRWPGPGNDDDRDKDRDKDRDRDKDKDKDKDKDPSSAGPFQRNGPTGRPFFVMELVHGIPLTEYCDQNRLTTRQRLQLFVPICQAVQHAHQKGIIHRDIKPSNIMVSLAEGIPVPKIIDFGVAKAIRQPLTEKTLYTSYGQMLGTPLYMSPEQALSGGSDVDTRTDIYSLGVLLYELLAGGTPFAKDRFRNADIDKMRRMIREEEPLRPSTRISTLGEAASTVSTLRSTDPGRLSNVLRGELDWIVMKALEKDRTRRYESASTFAKDVLRYLNHEPVEACPPSTTYRFRKYVQRNRPKVVALTAVVLALGGMTLFSLILFAVAYREERSLRETAQQSQRLAWRSQQRAEESALEARRMAYASDIMLANRAWNDGDLQQVIGLLDRHQPKDAEPDLRGFEWYYLRQLPRASHTELHGHQGAVYSVCRSPDGRLIATSGEDEMVCIHDADTCQLRTEIETGQGNVNGVAFAPDGRTIASAGGDGTVRIWDTDTGEQIRQIAANPGEGYAVLFSPDGELLVTCGDDPKIRLWDPHTGASQGTLELHSRAVEAVAISPDGRILGSASSDKQAVLWDLESRTPLRTLQAHHDRLSSIVFSPDGKFVATGSLDKTVCVWDATRAEVVSVFHHLDGVQCLAFGPEGRWLAAGDRGGTIRLWPRSWTLPDWSFGGGGLVRWCGISPDGCTAAAATWDRLLLRDLQSRQIRELALTDPTILRYMRDRGILNICAFSHTGTMFACLTEIYCADAASPSGWKLKTKLDEYHRKLACVAFSPDGRTLATGQRDGTISLWDTETGQRRGTLNGPGTQPILAVAYSPDGQYIASGGAASPVIVWGEEGTQEAVFEGHNGLVACVAFSPDGKLLASGGDDYCIRLWNLQTGRAAGSLTGHTFTVTGVAFSPDGSQLASSAVGNDRTVRIWDVASQTLLRTHAADAQFVSFLPDGQHVMSGGYDDSVRFWDLGAEDLGAESPPHRQRGRALGLHTGRVYSLTCLPRRRRWVSAGQDGKVFVSNPAFSSTEYDVDHPTRDFAFAPSGCELFIASPDGVFRVDRTTASLSAALPGSEADWWSVAAASRVGLVAAANRQGTVCLYDVRTQSRRHRWSVGDRVAEGQLALSPDGKYLAAVIWGQQNDAVQLFSTATGELVHAFNAEAPHAVSFSPDGSRLAADSQNDLLVWDVTTRRLVHTLQGHISSVIAIAFSWDGHLIASGGNDRTVRVWDADSGRLQLILTGHRDDVRSAAFSPDGRSLATADRGGSVKLWQVSTGQELMDLVNSAQPIYRVAFSRDGRVLAYLLEDRVRIIRLLDVEPNTALEKEPGS